MRPLSSPIRQKYTKLSSSQGWHRLLDEIKIYYVNTAPQAIRTLGQIATDKTVGTDLRIAVAAALARMHTQPSLPYLAQLLGDQNSTLRAMAVGGLSSFANNVPVGEHELAPGAWSYRTEGTIAHSVFDESAVNQKQAYYIGFWKDWWNRNQAALSPP
jgi:HEAT repeat protein